MSVLIKDMNIPENCYDCPFNYDYISCMASDEDVRVFLMDNERAKNCPLIKLSDHGDLIDRDAVWNDMVQTESFQEAQITLWNAPVVILAERSKE